MKELLIIKIYKDIEQLHEVNIDGTILRTRNMMDLFQAIRQTIDNRLLANHQNFMQQLKHQGIVKHVETTVNEIIEKENNDN